MGKAREQSSLGALYKCETKLNNQNRAKINNPGISSCEGGIVASLGVCIFVFPSLLSVVNVARLRSSAECDPTSELAPGDHRTHLKPLCNLGAAVPSEVLAVTGERCTSRGG